MFTKKLVSLSVLSLIIGLSVAALSLQSNFQLLNTYRLEAEIVYVYLNLFKVDEAVSGLGRRYMLSYVVVINVTNPSNHLIEMQDIDIRIAEDVQLTANQTGFTAHNGFVSFSRYLPQGDFSYFWQPNRTIPLVFSGVHETANDLVIWLEDSVDSLIEIRGRADDGGYATSGFVVKTLQLEQVNPHEFVYNNLSDIQRIHFTQDGNTLSFER